MARIVMRIVGAGFVGLHRVDAVRRFGFVDVVAVAVAGSQAVTTGDIGSPTFVQGYYLQDWLLHETDDLKTKVLEAAGVEPASESTSSWDSTCVSAS